MAPRGQVLERMTTVASGELALEALFATAVAGAEPGVPVVLAGPHPRFGGSMDSPVLTELVWTLARAGRATLRFNWRGVGASLGEHSVPPLPAPALPALDEEGADLAAALAHHAADGHVSLVGYSFGAAPAVAAAATLPEVDRLILIAPLVGLLRFDWEALARSGVPTAIFCGELDGHAGAAAVRDACGLQVPVVEIAGASHSFQRGLHELARQVAAAL
ncbi:MAG: alpha/beta fold hydrolase [Deltaproteobacteria bacterium]|nr:alpha/beta fold hydrolase [Deltaproteobacteria bacterium]